MADQDRHASLLAAMQRLVQAPDAPAEARADARRWFAADGLDDDDVTALAEQTPERLFVYRTLVRRGLLDAIRRQIPRTAARLGDAYARSVNAWIDEALPRSHYLRDVAFEFVAASAPHWAERHGAPSFLEELAWHELSAFEIGCAPSDKPALGERAFGLDEALAFDPSAKLFRYSTAIHRLDEDEGARDEPAAEPTRLLAYRDADFEIHYLELTPLADALLERLLAGEAVRSALAAACSAMGCALDDAALASSAELLSDLAERGVLLGTRHGGAAA